MVSKMYFHFGVGYTFGVDFDGVKWSNNIIIKDESGRAVSVPVRDCSGYAIKVNKTSVSAAGGARGLFCFLNNAIKENFLTSYCNILIDRFFNRIR